jgi:LuxR family maltose regulon positive regulatory protein
VKVARTVLRGGECREAPTYPTYEHLSIAPIQVLLAQGRAAAERASLQRALALLEQQRQEAERTGMPWRRIKALVLQALTYQALGDVTQSLIVLEQALVLAAPEGYVRIFLDEGAPMLALLRQAAAQGILQEYMRTLLASGGEVAPTRDPWRVDAGA